MNNVSMIGRLTRDPELKYTASGKAVCNFSIAVNRPFKKDEVDFFRCTAWGKTAEIIAQYQKKGNQIGILGNLQNNNYEDKDGNKRTSTEIIVNSFTFIGGNANNTSTQESNFGTFESGTVDMDDVPF